MLKIIKKTKICNSHKNAPRVFMNKPQNAANSFAAINVYFAIFIKFDCIKNLKTKILMRKYPAVF